MAVRINKFFTERGLCSRREADKLIQEGKVTINGVKAKLGDQVQDGDAVTLDGKPVGDEPRRVYIMYNKPRGITCTTDLKIAGNIIQAVNHTLRVFPIGRLDKDSTGLIFLTNDGDIVNQILRAQFGHEKEYVVQVSQAMNEQFLHKMAAGVDIGDHVTKPCRVKKINQQTFSIVLTEGKNRQIRRMCEALKQKVRSLHRVRIMNVLIGDLKEGAWKDLEVKDLVELKNQLDKNKTAGDLPVDVVEE